MSQRVRATQDISTGGWSPAPLYSKLNEEVPSDAEFISVSNPSSDAFEVLLSSLLGPPWDAGMAKLVVRLRRTNSDPAVVRIALLQGSTVIASTVAVPSSSFANAELILSAAQIASLTNSTDLRLRLSASCTRIDGCCDLGETLTGTISNKSGAAGNMPDTVTMTKGSNAWFSNTFANPCPDSASAGLTLQCDANTQLWSLIGANFVNFVYSVTGANCDTKEVSFFVTFNNSSNCEGSFEVTFRP